MKIRLTFVSGLADMVAEEVTRKTSARAFVSTVDSLYLEYSGTFEEFLTLKSVSTVSLVLEDDQYHPLYISRHKSILKNLIAEVVEKSHDKFTTFRLSCAGADTDEVLSIKKYIAEEFRLIEQSEADLKISIGKVGELWEIAVQVTRRPLSYRSYKVNHMSGAMDPVIAYALNECCDISKAQSYLNMCSGSATLLIEAALEYEHLASLVGIDNNKNHLSQAYHNIRKAGLIKRIQLLERDILDVPHVGMFDIIAADLPFGMVIGKNDDLEQLYSAFLHSAEGMLKGGGVVGVYTSEYETLMKVLDTSIWCTTKEVSLKLVTSVNSFLYPKIIILKRL
jgi:tRNA G10  N-methylase Trm11